MTGYTIDCWMGLSQ